MASHVTTDGLVQPPLNITAPTPIINLRGFNWTTVDKTINTAQRLEKNDANASANGVSAEPKPAVQQALLVSGAKASSPAAAAPAKVIDPEVLPQLSAQLGAPVGKKPPPLPIFPLEKFHGPYAGNGFNTIWRPRSNQPLHDETGDESKNLPNHPLKFESVDGGPLPNDNILELNLTLEQLTFGDTIGKIPNRGLADQPDVELVGLPYLQTVKDVTNIQSGRGDSLDPHDIHFEPGMWLVVPASTKSPNVGSSVVRMASIPHGTTIHAQCLAPKQVKGTITGGEKKRPDISPADITPFFPRTPGDPSNPPGFVKFSSLLSKNDHSPRIPQDLGKFNAAKTITDEIIKDPNTVLRNAIKDQEIIETIAFEVSTGAPPETPAKPPPADRTDLLNGGGTRNIAFLAGTQSPAVTNADPTVEGPNAHAAFMTSKFWIELVNYDVTVPAFLTSTPKTLTPTMPKGSTAPTPEFIILPPSKLPSKEQKLKIAGTQIQYSQQVNLNFAGLTWPHVSVATLVPSEPQHFQMPG